MTKKKMMTKESAKQLKLIKKALKDFPKIVKQKKIQYKKRKKILDAFQKEAPTILKQIGIKE